MSASFSRFKADRAASAAYLKQPLNCPADFNTSPVHARRYHSPPSTRTAVYSQVGRVLHRVLLRVDTYVCTPCLRTGSLGMAPRNLRWDMSWGQDRTRSMHVGTLHTNTRSGVCPIVAMLVPGVSHATLIDLTTCQSSTQPQ